MQNEKISFSQPLDKRKRTPISVLFSFPFGRGIEDSHHSAEGAGFAFAARGSVGGGAFDAPQNNKTKLRSGREHANPRHNFPQSLALYSIL